jgi:hypothetical protein
MRFVWDFYGERIAFFIAKECSFNVHVPFSILQTFLNSNYALKDEARALSHVKRKTQLNLLGFVGKISYAKGLTHE